MAAVERALLAAHGLHHAAGVYYASADDAARARRLAAERQLRDAARRAAWLAAHPCRWCGTTVGPTEPFDLVAGEPVHSVECVVALDALLAGEVQP